MPSLSKNATLAVIDMQEDFCEPNGSLAVKSGRELASTINKLLELPFRLKIATGDNHPPDHCSFASQHPGKQPFSSEHTVRNPESEEPDAEEQTTSLWPDHCVQGTPGAELIPELDLAKMHHIVKKGEDKRVESYSAFGPPFRKPAVGMSKLPALLEDNGIKRVFVCGLALDFCVRFTAVDAAERGFETYVIEDATKAVDQSPDALATTRKDMEERGVRFVSSGAEELRV